eukprot:4282261-Lingulodinium_polyedra.AAC.1
MTWPPEALHVGIVVLDGASPQSIFVEVIVWHVCGVGPAIATTVSCTVEAGQTQDVEGIFK